jgi:NADH:ubiquinone reductase (non-electrogenic)
MVYLGLTKESPKTNPATREVVVPYGMAIWSTGIGTYPIIMDFMKQVG